MQMLERYLFGKLAGVLLFGLLACSFVQAQPNSDLRWHGFFSQGAIHTDDNNFFGDSTDTSFDFRDLGVGFSWQAQNDLLLAAQLIYRDAGKTSPEGTKVDYALVNYSLINQYDFGLNLRVGRVKNPYAFYSETRDVASTRPSVILPVSIYAPAFRDIFHTSDSVMLSGYKEVANWLINFDLLRGKVPFDDKSERLLIPGLQPASIKNDKLWAARSIFEYDGGRIRLGLTYIKFDAEISTLPGMIFPGDVDSDSYIFSLEYNWRKFRFTSEYLRNDFIYKDVFAPGLDNKREAESYYFQLGYRVNERLRVFGRYDVYYADKNDKSGDGQLLLGRPKSDGFTKDYVVGAQYHFNDQWMLAGEVHHVKGSFILPLIENPDASQIEEDWNLYTLQLSYKF